jgi:hypothetical protein
MKTGRSSLAAALLVVLASLAACGDEGGDRPTCDAIGEICHDSASDAGQECHEFGEADGSTEEQCQEREEACRAECE